MKMYHDEWDNSHGGHVQQAIPWYFEGSLQGGEYASAGSQAVPETVGQIMQCVYTSLSLCYRDAIASLQKLTGKVYTSVNIVGGGCQDGYLNQRTAQATGLPVFAGPVEGTAIGNLIVQMIAGGDLSNLQAARDAIRASFEIKEVTP